ncbi:unnamed protein product [Adineta ricciae]|uniref:Uncharacterized protein n=1 Tax=Adineta ricciae TaxID=249248 RepID=A0A814FHC6_ADIRI|nr:unnamed protein product [Adineta ricciae]CAF1530762.1 unnamed protein product [Adineta ricciae]
MSYWELEACAFIYDKDGITRTAVGIRSSWEDLRYEFSRQGSSCPVENAIHYRTISTTGPKLFAVSPDLLRVFYHRASGWHQYRTARWVHRDTLLQLLLHLNRHDDDDDEEPSQEDNNGQDRKDSYGQQSKSLTPLNDLNAMHINLQMLYYCLLHMIRFVQRPIRSIQY